jgi:hypothetical protein
MDPESISTIAGLPVNSIPIIVTIAAVAFHVVRENKKATETEKRDAEIALKLAYNLTHGYYAVLQSGEGKNSQEEHKVANAWDDASIRLREFDINLSNRLSLKSRFWREGAAWSDDQIAMANIGLEDVRREGTVVLCA